MARDIGPKFLNNDVQLVSKTNAAFVAAVERVPVREI
jgi:hypothetical protein